MDNSSTCISFRRNKFIGVNSLRESLKCSPLPVIIKGIANTLKKHPLLNSSLLNDSEILLKDYINVGIAVNTENGLVVPVLKNPDKLEIQEINVSIKKLSEKARQKQLKKTDIEGASFTVSSLVKLEDMDLLLSLTHLKLQSLESQILGQILD